MDKRMIGDLLDWTQSALATQPERQFVSVDGARIEVLSWGKRGNPGLLLVHGFAANATWWSVIAPYLAAEGMCIAALSLSGTGQSDWRDRYALESCSREILAAMEVVGLRDGPVAPGVVAHSFGGVCAVHAMDSANVPWRGLMLVDAIVDERYSRRGGKPRRQAPRLFQRKEDAVARFRLRPDGPCLNELIFAHIAENFVRDFPYGEGAVGTCTWAADPELFIHFEGQKMLPALARLACPVSYVCGANSYIRAEAIRKSFRGILPEDTPVIEIERAGHHLMLDRPDALLHEIRAFFAAQQSGGGLPRAADDLQGV